MQQSARSTLTQKGPHGHYIAAEGENNSPFLLAAGHGYQSATLPQQCTNAAWQANMQQQSQRPRRCCLPAFTWTGPSKGTQCPAALTAPRSTQCGTRCTRGCACTKITARTHTGSSVDTHSPLFFGTRA
jgi:hypothetical protein